MSRAIDCVLTRRLKEMGMNLGDLAERVGYTMGSLSHLLHGRSYLQYGIAMEITKAVGLEDPRILFDDTGRLRP